MKLYNTLTRTIEDFVPNTPGIVKLYTCGPTVYHYAHIGNLRTYISEDILEKSLVYLGYKVDRTMNITDVGHLTSDSDSGEDKMLKGAKRENKTVREIADMYTEAFKQDEKKLNIKWPETVSNATADENIQMYIKIISNLLDKGYAYKSNGNIYFDITKLDDYYKLTNHKIDDMVVGVREGVEEDTGKKNQGDFVLWFTKSKFQDQEMKWDSPFGVGYPGWHIECSGISIRTLGEYLDIHCGAVDNIFPHHTNEIAQSEAYLGHKWCNYWMHTEHLNNKNGKMSKSSGDFLTLSLLESKGYNPLSFRYMCLNGHYRKVLEFSYETLDSNQNAYYKLLNRIDNIILEGDFNQEQFNKYKSLFSDTLKDDLNTSNSITVLYDVLKDNNLNGNTKIEIIRSFDEVLSLNLVKEKKELHISEEFINSQIELREGYKKEKNYQKADEIRDALSNMGIILIDSRDGVKFKYKD